MYLVKPQGSSNFILNNLVVTPLIWMMLFPILLTDILMEIYHHIVFPILGIPLVDRSKYIRVIDRAKLPYLAWNEKIGCAYCGYVNGWLHYASEVAGRTEQHFCAIAHLKERGYIAPEHEKKFVEYGDKEGLKKRYLGEKK
jgi:hypothetical protein